MADLVTDLFATHGVPLSADETWLVQGRVRVVKHSALERLAAHMGIRFDTPVIVRAERDEAVVLVTGRLAYQPEPTVTGSGPSKVTLEHLPIDRTEWSLGEALIGMNYQVSGKQAAYVYAMAEKRAKDRVIIKLARLHGIYSSEEADEFAAPREVEAARPVVSSGNRVWTAEAAAQPEAEHAGVRQSSLPVDSQRQPEFPPIVKRIAIAIGKCGNVEALDKLMEHPQTKHALYEASQEEFVELKTMERERRETLLGSRAALERTP